ncbi:MAG: transcription antitermination protein NusB [Rickettsiales bacterium]|jgi:N utilization substance protein B|nr:transcription antitermination protein NusB [Rickettsiales bacterium]
MKKINEKSIPRLISVQILFAYGEDENIEELQDFIEEEYVKEEFEKQYETIDRNFVSSLLKGVIEKMTEIDDTIKIAIAPKFKIENLEKIIKTIFRLAVYELKYTNIEKKIVVDDYVYLASQFSTNEKSVNFVNAILDNVK